MSSNISKPSSNAASNVIIEVKGVGKCYQIYSSPQDRVKETFLPKLQSLIAPLVKLFKPNWEIRQRYSNDFWALSDISFELKKGETVGIIGRNGSGKSTLLQLICGTLTPTTGFVKIHERRIAALLELGAGFNPEFTGRENVYLNASLFGLSKKEIDERYEKILDFADIGDFIHQAVKVYSSGMFLRLAFAVIANVDADVLIIDEALAVGDTFFQQKCMRFLNKFRERGAVLFVSHDTHSVSNLCDYAIWLDAGKMRAIGDAKRVCEQYYGMQYQEYAFTHNSKMVECPILETETSGISGSKSDSVASPKAGIRGSAGNIISQSEIIPELLSKDRKVDERFKAFNYDGIKDFGTGEATIINVELLNAEGSPLTWITGGEIVELVIAARINHEITSPIIGFVVKDRLGQYLFGDNTYLTNPTERAKTSSYLEASFKFTLPLLRSGEYSIAAAIASGTIDEHAQLHWIHDALAFTVHSDFRYEILMHIPMTLVSLKLTDESELKETGEL